MKTIKDICSIACFFINLIGGADPVITFNFKPYPTFPSSKYCHQVMKELGKMSRSCTLGILDKHLPVGIFVTYAGYLTVSDSEGEVSFPSRQSKKETPIDILITTKIVPIMMAGNTVHHWVIDENTQAAMFRFALEKDPQTKLSFWDVKSVPILSTTIPLQTIIILADPKYIEVETGTTPMRENANSILPDIYVKKGLKTTSQAFYTLNIKHLFGTLHYLNKNEPKHGVTLLNP